MDEIPTLGEPFAVRDRRDIAVVLDAFTPTHLDVWTARAVVVPAGVRGVPSDAPSLLADDPEGALVVRALVVRHAGAVSGRRPLFGARRRRLESLLSADPPDDPLLGLVVERGEVSAVWVSGPVPAAAAALSDAGWRTSSG